MRLLIVLAALAMPFAASPAQPPTSTDPRVKPLNGRTDCRPSMMHPADGARKGEFKRLGELPPGNLSLTVYRQVDGCPDPVIVRYGIGSLGEGRPLPDRRQRAKRW